MEAKEFLKEWLQTIFSGIVSHPEDVRIEVKVDEMGVLYTLSCHTDDTGKVIGKKGVMATSVRTLLTTAGMARDVRACLKINVPDFRQP